MKFESKSEKPKNLIFKLEGEDRKYQNLDEMEEDLQEKINKSEKINIIWSWEYENSKKHDEQDTKDAERIRQYNFVVYAISQT